MATIAAKLPDATARAFKAKAKRLGKTPSEVVRDLVEEWVAPPSDDWIDAVRRLPRLGKPRKRPKDVDPLTWAIDTTL